jgi:hypothetical protein
MRFSSLALLMALTLGCPQGRITGPIDGLPFATATPSCGPADGPAVRITFASTNDPNSRPHLFVTIYDGLPQLTRTWILTPDVGFAAYVTAPDEMESARSAVVEIERIDAARTITGTVHLVFDQAGVFRGRFRATWVPQAGLCG